jgi:hypothetical protein
MAVLAAARDCLRTRAALQMEVLALRHQLKVLRRSVKRPKLTAADRFLWIRLSRFWTGWRSALLIVKPETVIGWHPLHWASATWENGSSNPVYGFEDPMSGIPDRRQKLELVKALLAHGAEPNARMKRRPPVGGGYTDVNGATPFLLASSVDDVEMMRILLATEADPKLVTGSKTTPMMAASGLDHSVGESAVTEAQALAAVHFLLDLGLDPKGSTTFGENALFGPAYRGWNTLLAQLIGQDRPTCERRPDCGSRKLDLRAFVYSTTRFSDPAHAARAVRGERRFAVSGVNYLFPVVAETRLRRRKRCCHPNSVPRSAGATSEKRSLEESAAEGLLL